MKQPYVTVTLEASGGTEALMRTLHQALHALLQDSLAHVSFGTVHLAYQDTAELEQEAPLRPEHTRASWDENVQNCTEAYESAGGLARGAGMAGGNV